MKKLTWALGGVLGLVLIGVLVVPALIDWNDYKTEISQQVFDATGRELTLGGDLKIQVLPAPALKARDVRLANIQGGRADDMVQLETLEVRVAFFPLLRGEVQVNSVRLIKPVVTLETLSDGRANWEMLPTESATSGASEKEEVTNAGEADVASAIRLDDFVIEDGVVVYLDGKTGTQERVSAINARIRAETLNGPFESHGALSVRGQSLSFVLTAGRLAGGGSIPLTLNLEAAGDAKVQIGGAVVDVEKNPRFTGKISASLSDVPAFVTALSGQSAISFNDAVGVESDLQASKSEIALSNLKLEIGAATANGNATIALAGKTPRFNVSLRTAHLDIDHWLAGASRTSAISVRRMAKRYLPVASAHAAESGPGIEIPNALDGTLDIVVDAATLNKGVMREARLALELADGEITISQATAQLPGVTEVSLFGTAISPKGALQFNGELEAASADVPALAAWAGVALPPSARKQLHRMSLRSKVRGDMEKIVLQSVDARLEKTRLTGAATLALRKRLSFGVDIDVDQLDLDALTASAPETPKTTTSKQPTESGKASTAGGLAGLSALGTFDANIKVQVNQLVAGGKVLRDATFDGTLYNGALTVRKAGVADVAGAQLALDGVVSGFNAIPELKDLRVSVNVASPSRTWAALGIKSGAPTIGTIKLDGAVNGSMLNPSLDMTLAAVDAKVNLKGSVLPVPVIGGFDGTLQIVHGDAAALLAVLRGQKPPRDKTGPVKIAANLKADAKSVVLSEIKGDVGPTAIAGSVNVDIGKARPNINVNLDLGAVPIHTFMGVASKDGASQDGPSSAGAGTTKTQASSASRWSKEKIDVSALRDMDGRVVVHADVLAWDVYRLDNARIEAELSDGVMRVTRMDGMAFDGPLQAKAELNVRATPKFTAALSLEKVNVGKVLQAASNKDLASGMMKINLPSLSAEGDSVFQWVNTLGGTGDIAVTDLNVKQTGQGAAMAGLLGLVGGLNDVAGVLVGRKPGQAASMHADFNMARGVAVSDNVVIEAGLGSGKASGILDLPKWLIDVEGKVVMSDLLVAPLLKGGDSLLKNLPLDQAGILGQVLGSQTQQAVSREMFFAVKGALDTPNVKIRRGKAPTAETAPAPSPRTPVQSAPLEPGQLPPPPSPSQSTAPGATPGTLPPPPPKGEVQPTAPQKIRPEDVLKGILQKL